MDNLIFYSSAERRSDRNKSPWQGSGHDGGDFGGIGWPLLQDKIIGEHIYYIGICIQYLCIYIVYMRIYTEVDGGRPAI